MVTFSRTPDADIRAAHRQKAAERAAVKPATPKNVRHLIDIGNNRVMLYRRTPIVVPPVPVMLGLDVWDLTTRLEAEEDTAQRRVLLRALIRACTRCVEPVLTPTRGPFKGVRRRLRRVRWGIRRRLGLWRPFRDISEGELRGVADFLQRCRQSASILAH